MFQHHFPGIMIVMFYHLNVNSHKTSIGIKECSLTTSGGDKQIHGEITKIHYIYDCLLSPPRRHFLDSRGSTRVLEMAPGLRYVFHAIGI